MATPSIQWTDDIGAATLACIGYTFMNWTPDSNFIGESQVPVGDNVTYTFAYRPADEVATFDIGQIANTELRLALRLKKWLVRGGQITINTRDSESRVYTARVAPGTTPELKMTDPIELEYTLTVHVTNVVAVEMMYTPWAHLRLGGITFSPSPISMVSGGSDVTVVATVTDSAGSPAAGVSLAGRSSDTGKFTFSPSSGTTDGSGHVTFTLHPVAGGSATFSAMAGSVSASDAVTISSDDMAILADLLGGRVHTLTERGIAGLWSTRRGVRLAYSGGQPIAWDDESVDFVGRPTGRMYFPGYTTNEALDCGTFTDLNGAAAATIGVWGVARHVGAWDSVTQGTILGQWGSDHGFILELNGSYDFQFYLGGSGSNYGKFSAAAHDARSIAGGLPYKAFVVFDGAGAANADRLKMYLSVWDDTLNAWGTLNALTLTFGGTIPSTWPTTSSEHLYIGKRGDGGGDKLWGILDDVRIYDAALTSSDIGDELTRAEGGSDTTAHTPLLWYRFDEALGAATIVNHGSSSGHAAAMDAASHATLLSDDIDNGKCPILFTVTYAPAWDGTAKTLTFSGSEWGETGFQRRFSYGATAGLGFTGGNEPFGLFMVGTIPSGTEGLALMVWGSPSNRMGLSDHSSKFNGFIDGAYSSPDSGIATGTTRRVYAIRKDYNTAGQYVHSAGNVEGSAAGAEVPTTIATISVNSYGLNGTAGGSYGSNGVIRAIGFMRGAPTDDELDAIGVWGVAYEAAVEAL